LTLGQRKRLRKSLRGHTSASHGVYREGHAFVRLFETTHIDIDNSLICWQKGPHFGAADQADPLQRTGVTHLDEGSAPDCKVARCKTQGGSLPPTCIFTAAAGSRTAQGWIPICRLSRPPVRSWLVLSIHPLLFALTQVLKMPGSLICRLSRHASTPRRPHFGALSPRVSAAVDPIMTMSMSILVPCI
jgi:hypothetical protein